jgi:hypothetical protein
MTTIFGGRGIRQRAPVAAEVSIHHPARSASGRHTVLVVTACVMAKESQIRALHHNAPRIYSRALREITPVSALYEIARDHGHSVICTAAPASPSQQ